MKQILLIAFALGASLAAQSSTNQSKFCGSIRQALCMTEPCNAPYVLTSFGHSLIIQPTTPEVQDFLETLKVPATVCVVGVVNNGHLQATQVSKAASSY